MTKAQCEKKLAEIRRTLEKVKRDLDTAVLKQRELENQRENLAVGAAVGDEKAQAALKEINRERFDLQSFIEEYKIAVRKLETDIVRAERDYETALFQIQKEELLKLGQKRVEIGKEFDVHLAHLIAAINQSYTVSEQMAVRASDIGFNNTETAIVSSRLNVVDALSLALHGVLRQLQLPNSEQRKPLAELESFALERLTNKLKGMLERNAA
jgi:hypothetical protein